MSHRLSALGSGPWTESAQQTLLTMTWCDLAVSLLLPAAACCAMGGGMQPAKSSGGSGGGADVSQMLVSHAGCKVQHSCSISAVQLQFECSTIAVLISTTATLHIVRQSVLACMLILTPLKTQDGSKRHVAGSKYCAAVKCRHYGILMQQRLEQPSM